MRRTIAVFLVRAADAATRLVTRLSGEFPDSARSRLSGAELRDLVEHNAVLDSDERQLIADVLATGDRSIRELMVPRTEVVFLDAGLSLRAAAALACASPHSRFPVIDTSSDDVIGFVHLRDLMIRPSHDEAVTVADVARELRRLPASKRALAALSEMRRDGVHLALVVDEYGGTAGIVTLEDLLEELVGEIRDEYDATPITRAEEVEGLLNLGDFAEQAGFALPAGPYGTVGGFVMAELGRLPRVGDEVSVMDRTGEWLLRVVELDGRRVSRVRVIKVADLALA